jgi:hypothetical protein
VRRRELICLLGAAGATWPLAGRAQQTYRMRRVGVLLNAAESDLAKQASSARFVHAWRNWVGAKVATFNSIIAGRTIVLTA